MTTTEHEHDFMPFWICPHCGQQEVRNNPDTTSDLLECLQMAISDLEALHAPSRAIQIYRDAVTRATSP